MHLVIKPFSHIPIRSMSKSNHKIFVFPPIFLSLSLLLHFHLIRLFHRFVCVWHTLACMFSSSFSAALSNNQKCKFTFFMFTRVLKLIKLELELKSSRESGGGGGVVSEQDVVSSSQPASPDKMRESRSVRNKQILF